MRFRNRWAGENVGKLYQELPINLVNQLPTALLANRGAWSQTVIGQRH